MCWPFACLVLLLFTVFFGVVLLLWSEPPLQVQHVLECSRAGCCLPLRLVGLLVSGFHGYVGLLFVDLVITYLHRLFVVWGGGLVALPFVPCVGLLCLLGAAAVELLSVLLFDLEVYGR